METVPSPATLPAGALPHPLSPYPPLLINTALTGMIPMPESVPHVPITSEDIVGDADVCFQAGATILHLHARGSDGRPAWQRELYEAFIPAIRERCAGVVICVTTSGRTFAELEQRADVLHLTGLAKPDMASLTLGSLNFTTGASVNDLATIEELARRMLELGIKPELEIFDTGMAYLAGVLLERGLLEPPLYANLMLGSINTAPASADALAHLVRSLPKGTIWAAAGLGGFQLPMNALAIFMGGHVRTGLEDNPYLDYQAKTPATNRGLVDRVTQLAELAGRSPATAELTRAWLGLPAT